MEPGASEAHNQGMARDALARRLSREEADCIDFDDAIEAYLDGGDPLEMLQASLRVLGSALPLDEEKAKVMAALTGCTTVLVDYDDAARAVRGWFALVAEPGARH
jgi:hypothetical protein